VEDRTITATIELLKGGCLPGDVIPIKISVHHIKRIKSMHGVIVTLYRQGRIDSSPPISLFKGLSKEDIQRLEKEEYYPRSRTGLGGLSLSSAGSCGVFRKDLSQAFSPLIIDPVTLTSSVTTSVRVPEDVFPTIKGIPGDLITFKYQLEVIVDLGGKLASQIQSGQSSISRVGTMTAPGMPINTNPYEAGAASLASWGGSVIDTDQLRREKGVISVAFEIVVGTTDSTRQRGRGVVRPGTTIYTQPLSEMGRHEGVSDEKGQWRNGFDEDIYAHQDHPDEYWGAPAGHSSYHESSADMATAPFYIPPPEIPSQNGLSEKDRIRQAEQRLLPSQPPAASSSAAAGPSRSAFSDADNIYDADDSPQAGPSSAPVLSSDEPSAPTLEDISANTGAGPTDDKRELERQRLLAEASAPPEFPEDADSTPVAGPSNSSASASAPPPAGFEPSAPVLSDEEEYGPQYSYRTMGESSSHSASAPAEPLPRYER
jgi:hypothetical protein